MLDVVGPVYASRLSGIDKDCWLVRKQSIKMSTKHRKKMICHPWLHLRGSRVTQKNIPFVSHIYPLQPVIALSSTFNTSVTMTSGSASRDPPVALRFASPGTGREDILRKRACSPKLHPLARKNGIASVSKTQSRSPCEPRTNAAGDDFLAL